MANAFFYWTALPADDAELLLSFDQWLIETGTALVRIETFVTEVPTLRNGFAPEKKNAFIVVSSAEELPPEFMGVKLQPATESTTMAPLGQLPFEEADKARAYRLTVHTDEEGAGSWVSDRDGGDGPLPPKKASIGGIVVFFGLVGLASILLAAAPKQRR